MLIETNPELVNAQVRGDISMNGTVWQDGERIPVTSEHPQYAGALHFAAFHGHAKLAQLLLECGADIKTKARFGRKEGITPVELAAWEGDVATLRTLLEAGAAANIEMQLRPALYTALAHGAMEKVDLLVAVGADINRESKGFTPLAAARKANNEIVATALLDHGAKG